MSTFDPPEEDVVELKYAGGKVSLPLARMSKTLYAFGYMADCVILDSEPNDVGQVRLLSQGLQDWFVSVRRLTHSRFGELVPLELCQIVRVSPTQRYVCSGSPTLLT